MATAVGPALGEQAAQLDVNDEETFRERCVGRAADRPAGDEAMAPAVGVDAAVAGALGAGIDPEDPHAREASISFSSMSKFDQTCLTSS